MRSVCSVSVPCGGALERPPHDVDRGGGWLGRPREINRKRRSRRRYCQSRSHAHPSICEPSTTIELSCRLQLCDRTAMKPPEESAEQHALIWGRTPTEIAGRRSQIVPDDQRISRLGSAGKMRSRRRVFFGRKSGSGNRDVSDPRNGAGVRSRGRVGGRSRPR